MQQRSGSVYYYCYDLPDPAHISLLSGKHITTLLNNIKKDAGSYEITWKGTNGLGQKVAPGAYFYQLRRNNKVFIRKMILLR